VNSTKHSLSALDQRQYMSKRKKVDGSGFVRHSRRFRRGTGYTDSLFPRYWIFA
jgi:hypothetical protein